MNIPDLFAKMTYLKINMDAIKNDPAYWKSLSIEKQKELHAIKKELDDFFGNINATFSEVNQNG